MQGRHAEYKAWSSQRPSERSQESKALECRRLTWPSCAPARCWGGRAPHARRSPCGGPVVGQVQGTLAETARAEPACLRCTLQLLARRSASQDLGAAGEQDRCLQQSTCTQHIQNSHGRTTKMLSQPSTSWQTISERTTSSVTRPPPLLECSWSREQSVDFSSGSWLQQLGGRWCWRKPWEKSARAARSQILRQRLLRQRQRQ